MDEKSEKTDDKQDKSEAGIPYASTLIHFLNRTTQTIEAVTYPITRIDLQEITSNAVVVVRTFVVVDGDKWVELIS